MTADARRSFALFLESSGQRGREWSGKLLGAGVGADVVQAALGPPDLVEGATFGYAFPERAGYAFVFVYDERGVQVRSGYRRLGPARQAPPLGGDHAAYVRLLASLGVTGEELVAWFGEPTREGWWPWETLRFGNGLEVPTRLGVVDFSQVPEITK